MKIAFVKHLFASKCNACCQIIFGIMFLHSALAESPSNLRLFPYPFAHSISFASDVDMQKPSHGAGIHRVFNEELGLTISDSLWPHGGNPTSSALFSGPELVNRTPSGFGTIPTFALLLREWHRGNIDHFHGWQDDSAVPLRNEFPNPQALSQLRTTITLPPVPEPLLGQRAQNIRFYFSSPPPSDLQVVLREKGGKVISFGIGNIEGSVQVREGHSEWIKEILIPTDDQILGGAVLNPFLVESIDFVAPSCGGGCSVKLTRVERDHFSRRTVLSQLPLLEAWNIRPALLTSHGGNSLAQDFGSGDGVLDLPRTPGTIYADQAVVVKLEALANAESRHAYHSDLLVRLGVVGVWSYFHPQGDRTYVSLNSSLGRSNLPLTNTYAGLYDVPRSKGEVIDISSRESFVKGAESVYPDLTVAERELLYCGPGCNVSQGDALPQLIAKSIQVVNKQKNIARGLFYTHFGSGAGVPEVKGTYENPVTAETYLAMKSFSNHVYNFDGSIPLNKRIWSPPANTWLRYEILTSSISNNIIIDKNGATITINPWLDSITKKEVPDLNAGARDLHGLTIYVKDPVSTRVFAGKKEIKTIVKNPPDQTGKSSITLVDDNTPTSIVGRVPLSRRGTVTIRDGSYYDVKSNEGGLSYIRLVAGPKGRAEIIFRPNRLDLWNTTHIFYEARKKSELNEVSSGRLTIKLVMADGGSVVLTEDDSIHQAIKKSSYWYVPYNPVSIDWYVNTLDVAQLNFTSSFRLDKIDRPALPVGRVQEIHLQFEKGMPGDTLDLAKLLALRPSGNGEAANGTKLVAGRVTSDGRISLPRVLIHAQNSQGKKLSTATDRDGYYFFFGQPRGEMLTVSANYRGTSCFPLQGQEIEIIKNEFELDIICQPPNKYHPKRILGQ